MATQTEKLDTLIILVTQLNERQEDMGKSIEAIQISLTAQNGRLRKIEDWKSRIIGIGVAAVGVTSFIIHFIFEKLGWE